MVSVRPAARNMDAADSTAKPPRTSQPALNRTAALHPTANGKAEVYAPGTILSTCVVPGSSSSGYSMISR